MVYVRTRFLSQNEDGSTRQVWYAMDGTEPIGDLETTRKGNAYTVGGIYVYPECREMGYEGAIMDALADALGNARRVENI